MAALYGSEVKCVSVEWDFLQGLLVKNQPVPCLQALRKEKSRNAARSRRGKENFEFYELAKMLPLPGAITSQLDKASIVRLTISYLKMRDFANHGDPPWSLRAEGPSPPGKAAGRRNMNTLLTELFEQHLGGHILQVELTGSSIFDYVHPGDHPEVAEQLGLKPPSETSHSTRPKAPTLATATSSSGLTETSESDPASSHPAEGDVLDRSFFIRLKSTLTKRGLHVKTSGYKVIHVTGRLRPRLPSFSHAHSLLGRVMGLVALAHTLPPSTLSEVRIECHMFVFRVNMDLQIVYCESRISDYMDLTPSELVGKSCYQFIHGEDVEGIRQSHLDLLNKGQVVTQYYRWLQKNGGFVWVQSCATISVNVKNPTEKNMVWVNYILSKPECKNTVLDIFQLPGIPARQTEAVEVGPEFKESSLAKESSHGRKLYSPSKPGSLAEGYPRSAAEAGARCRLAETDSSGPETSYREEELSDGGGGSDTEGPPSKHIKLEFQPESPSREAKEASSEESDSGSESELGLLPQQRASLARKANGCKAGGRRSAGPGRPEFASVIQTQKSSVLKATPAPNIKSEQPPGAKGAPWTCPAAHKGSPYTVNKALSLEKPSLRPASSHLYVSIPDSVLTPPEMESGAPKGPFGTSPRTVPAASSSADTLSPPLSGSPCEERATSTPFTPLLYPADMEVLQRFHAGNVVVPLVHQLGGPHAGTSGSQGLYATSTIRYAPADMTLGMQSNVLPPSHPINLMDIGGAEAKTPRELMYHHLQRLNMVAPFGNSASLAQISGGAFAATDSLFSTLPFSMAGSGVHGASALERKED
ncbi:neuronal PAS domain-containing protein 1 isoform X2 [Podarcis raffonei]|uniref:neuronal PAS domain-containing protein 1 isoform X2 n=1 Tax=Podarcis raffonei TaxID=65483 RepID=UPI0023292962|nr:neuronal PAS domain-containing protein 1 isoform X2 [Podarcis raffonei]